MVTSPVSTKLHSLRVLNAAKVAIVSPGFQHLLDEAPPSPAAPWCSTGSEENEGDATNSR